MKYAIWIVLIAALAAGGWYWWKQQHPPPVAAVPPAPPPAEPPIEHPIEQAQVSEDEARTPAPLPELADSDSAVLDALNKLFGAGAVALLYPDGLIHRIVATVDNLPREKVAQRLMPVHPTPGKFMTAPGAAGPEIGAANAARYAPYVEWVERVDAHQLVVIYRRFYPLFQQAYRELGYPRGYFNDRLIAAIDNLLAAPAVAQPIRLQQPGVLYQFADPDLEARSAGQKIMLRIGDDNAAIVKKKLRELRRELTSKAEAAG